LTGKLFKLRGEKQPPSVTPNCKRQKKRLKIKPADLA